MKFLVTFTERSYQTDEERQATLSVRLRGLRHLQQLAASARIDWAFASSDRTSTIYLVEANSLESLDALIKASPTFPHVDVSCVPTIGARAVAREILNNLARDGAVPSALTIPEAASHRSPTAEGHYWLIYKEVPPFSPTVSEQYQRDTLERTVQSKNDVDTTIEFADLNAVGRMAGYLIGQGTREAVSRYVAQCAVGQDITWSMTPLIPLEKALLIEAADSDVLRTE